jgi:hypothetical protein
MSLLDDVSIVVTPNGYKAGTLYGVIPTYTEGADKVTDGDFPLPNVNWTVATGWAIAGNEATCSSGNSSLTQDVSAEIGKQYKVTFDISTFTSGTLYTDLGGASGQTTTTTGSKTFYFTATSTGLLRFYGGAFRGSIGNVIVKEVTASDMDVTRATAATRVDEDGLVNYAEILGDDMITDGNFSSSVDWQEQDTSNTIAGNQALWTASPHGKGFKGFNANDNIFTAGKTYRITYTIDSITSGEVRIRYPFIGTTYDSTGTYPLTVTETGVALSGGGVDLFMQNLNSTTAAISNIIAKEVTRDNVPRIDYTGGGCPHILAEPARTNLITYSEDLTNAFYLTVGMFGIAESTTLSPDGTGFGYTIIPFSTSSNHYFNYNYGQLTVAIGDEVTYSIFVKPNGYNFIQIASSSNFPAKYQNFELTGDGVIGTGDISGKTIEKIGDWYRCSVTETALGVNPRFLLSPSETALATRNPVYSGNATDGVLGWGAQVEVGSYPTSYIPNFGTSSGVTRAQDVFSRDGIGSLINSTEGVLFVEAALLSDDDSNKYISISDGTDDNKIQIDFDYSLSRLQYVVKKETGVQVNLKLSYTGTNMDKIAVKWKENDFAVWLNGVEIGTDTSGLVPIGLNTLNFSSSGSNHFQGKVKQLQVYDTALGGSPYDATLSDTRLAALTS